MDICRIAVPATINMVNAASLLDTVRRAGTDDSVSVVVLHGDNGVFCLGLDLQCVTPAQNDNSGVESVCHAVVELLKTIFFLPKPVIAVVDGDARGGGVGLAAACDVVMATNRSGFGLPEAAFGLVPAIIMPILLQRMQLQKIRRLALTCETINASCALELGLADMVVEENMAENALQRLTRQFRHADPDAVRILKEYTGNDWGGPVSGMIERGSSLTAAMLGTETVRTRIGAFPGRLM